MRAYTTGAAATPDPCRLLTPCSSLSASQKSSTPQISAYYHLITLTPSPSFHKLAAFQGSLLLDICKHGRLCLYPSTNGRWLSDQEAFCTNLLYSHPLYTNRLQGRISARSRRARGCTSQASVDRYEG